MTGEDILRMREPVTDADVLQMLRDIGSTYEARLETEDAVTWTLTLGECRTYDRKGRPFIYRGTLESVIKRAWAGSPPDELGEL